VNIPDTEPSRWCAATLWCEDWRAAEHLGVTQLAPRLAAAARNNQISLWWFTRKASSWRLRWRPATATGGQTPSGDPLQGLLANGATVRWVPTVYEPEIHAFGGPEGMDVAHLLFHADSRNILAHLGQAHPDHRREVGLVLAGTLLTAAGQDYYERGDVWTRVAAHRHAGPGPVPAPATRAAVSRLLTASSVRPLDALPGWPAAFRHAGQSLARIADEGHLTRGIRAVLAHHILFAWNRLGIPAADQATLAHTAARIVFDNSDTTPTSAPRRTVTPTMTTKTPDQLRDDLVAEIRRYGTFRTARVEDAFRAVPRHRFLPGVDLETAYAARVIVTRRAADGTALSSASDPDLVAAMLEQAEVRPGHRILEIGTATGINAALLAELTGPTGHVTTIEIDEDLATEARGALAAASYETVGVIHGDGAAGHPDGAPYDRIVITAGAWDIAVGWWDQLAPTGRIVVPLRLHGSGLTRSLALDAVAPGRLESCSALVCGFVPLRGADAHTGRMLALADGVTLRLDHQDPADEHTLRAALDGPAHGLWTGQTIHDHEPTGHLDLWLVTTGTRFGRIAVDATARKDRGLTPTPRWAGATIHDGSTIAYVTLRPVTSDTDELGVAAHGPHAADLATHLADLLHRWRKEGPSDPLVTALRTGTLDHQLTAGYHLDRPNSQLTVSWPR